MSFSCSQHGWSHLMNPCPWCFQYSMSGDATDTSKITFTKEQAVDLAIETWKAREVCWNTEREQLQAKLSAAKKERDAFRNSSDSIYKQKVQWENDYYALRKLAIEVEKERDSLKTKLAVTVEALKELCTGLYYTSRSSCIHICERTLKAIDGVREGLV